MLIIIFDTYFFLIKKTYYLFSYYATLAECSGLAVWEKLRTIFFYFGKWFDPYGLTCYRHDQVNPRQIVCSLFMPYTGHRKYT